MQNNLRIYTIDREIVEIQFNTAPFATGNELREKIKSELINLITPKGNTLRKGKCIFLDEKGHEEDSGYFFTITRGKHADIADLTRVYSPLFYRSLWGEKPERTRPTVGEAIDLPF